MSATWTTSLTANGGAAPNVTRIRAERGAGALALDAGVDGEPLDAEVGRWLAGSGLSRSASGAGAAVHLAQRPGSRPIRCSSVAPAAITPNAADRHQHVIAGAADRLGGRERVGGGGGEQRDRERGAGGDAVVARRA